MGYLKGILTLLITIWILGASGIAIYLKIEQKHTCIKTKGYIEGLLSCDGETLNKLGFAADQTNFFIKGLKWPLTLTSKNEEKVLIENDNYLCGLFLQDLEKEYQGKGTPEISARIQVASKYIESPMVLEKLTVLINNRETKSTQNFESIIGDLMDNTFSVCTEKPYINVKKATYEALDYL